MKEEEEDSATADGSSWKPEPQALQKNKVQEKTYLRTSPKWDLLEWGSAARRENQSVKESAGISNDGVSAGHIWEYKTEQKFLFPVVKICWERSGIGGRMMKKAWKKIRPDGAGRRIGNLYSWHRKRAMCSAVRVEKIERPGCSIGQY